MKVSQSHVVSGWNSLFTWDIPAALAHCESTGSTPGIISGHDNWDSNVSRSGVAKPWWALNRKKFEPGIYARCEFRVLCLATQLGAPTHERFLKSGSYSSTTWLPPSLTTHKMFVTTTFSPKPKTLCESCKCRKSHSKACSHGSLSWTMSALDCASRCLACHISNQLQENFSRTSLGRGCFTQLAARLYTAEPVKNKVHFAKANEMILPKPPPAS